MVRSISMLAIALSILPTASARAQTADMAKLTCDELTRLAPDELVVIGAWLSGYYNAKHNNTVVDAKRLKANTQQIMQFCQANPKVTAMQAIEKLVTEGR